MAAACQTRTQSVGSPPPAPPPPIVAPAPVDQNQIALEIVSKTHEYFSAAFTNLLWVLGAAFALIGIGVPIIVQIVVTQARKNESKRLLRAMRESMRAKMKAMHVAAKAMAQAAAEGAKSAAAQEAQSQVEQIRKEAEQVRVELRQQVRTLELNAMGAVYIVQSAVAWDGFHTAKGGPNAAIHLGNAITSSSRAIENFAITGEKPSNLQAACDNLAMQLKSVTAKLRKENGLLFDLVPNALQALARPGLGREAQYAAYHGRLAAALEEAKNAN